MNARKILTLMAADALESSGQSELAALVRAAQIDDYECSGPTSSFQLMNASFENDGRKRVSPYYSRFTPEIVRRFMQGAAADRLELIFALPLDVTRTQEIVTVVDAEIPDWLAAEKLPT